MAISPAFASKWLLPRIESFQIAWPDTDVHLYPVCSPQLLREHVRLQKLNYLAGETLIHDQSMDSHTGFPTWDQWLQKAGVTDAATTRGMKINNSAAVLQAANVQPYRGWRRSETGYFRRQRRPRPHIDLSAMHETHIGKPGHFLHAFWHTADKKIGALAHKTTSYAPTSRSKKSP